MNFASHVREPVIAYKNVVLIALLTKTLFRLQPDTNDNFEISLAFPILRADE